MARTPFVLIVGENGARRRQWAQWLDDAGFGTLECEGPHLNRCPRLDGKRCALREIADVAVVELHREEDTDVAGRPERSCTRLPDDGRTLFACDQILDRARLPLPVTRGSLVFAVERARASRDGEPGLWTRKAASKERPIV